MASNWRPGQDAPTMPKPSVDRFNHDGDRTVEINSKKYGDAWDPTVPFKVRQVPWDMDTDEDGQKN